MFAPSACADGAPPRMVQPTPAEPTAPTPDAGAVAGRPPRPVPPEPTAEFPYSNTFAGYIDAFRDENVDEDWAKPIEATLRSQLTTLDPNVARVRLVECRCGLCLLSYIVAPGGEVGSPQPGVDLPAVRWSGYEKLMRRERADGWTEILVMLGRHPKDSFASSPRVRSTDSPWLDPACADAIPFSPAWLNSSRSNWTGIGINRMYLAMASERVCPCLCGKVQPNAHPGCRYHSDGFVYCGLTKFTPRGLPIIEGEWSCKRTEPSVGQ